MGIRNNTCVTYMYIYIYTSTLHMYTGLIIKREREKEE